jgi:hypothetical protein
MHKVQRKPKKNFRWGHKQIWSKGLESVLRLVHQKVSGVPDQAPNEQATLGNSLGALRYNSPDCPVSGEPAEQRSLHVNSRLQK